MSRNRPRPRDNGLGNNEEMELWTRICQDIRKSKEKFDQQASLSVQIKTLVEKITRDGNSECPFPLPRTITCNRGAHPSPHYARRPSKHQLKRRLPTRTLDDRT